MRELVEQNAGANVGVEKGDTGRSYANRRKSSVSKFISTPGTLLATTRMEEGGASTRETVSESVLSRQNTLT
jgi:hypothetical protein